MADSLFELLASRVDRPESLDPTNNHLTSSYTDRLCTLSLASLDSTEPDALEYDFQSSLRSLQALAKRSYKSINASADSLSHLRNTLPHAALHSRSLQASLPALESRALEFSNKYSKPSENPVLDRRKKACLLVENSERVSDMLEIPALLSSIVSAPTGTGIGSSTAAGSSSTASYASALDLYTHTKRLQRLYPHSDLIASLATQAEEAMRGLASSLISALRAQSLKLAGGIRLIGLLRRVAPDLSDPAASQGSNRSWTSMSEEGSYSSLFLVCRLANLTTMLEALEPLRELADQESSDRPETRGRADDRNAWTAGQQTERYLKRYIEVFREQCFAIVSMCKSIFSLSGPESEPKVPESATATRSSSHSFLPGREAKQGEIAEDSLTKLPSALSTFIMELVDMLTETLCAYLPNVADSSSRNSLLTQVLYCAGSLGRLGGDFGMMLALLEDEIKEPVPPRSEENDSEQAEWIDVMKRHKIQASRLELLASGVGTKSSGLASKELMLPS